MCNDWWFAPSLGTTAASLPLDPLDLILHLTRDTLNPSLWVAILNGTIQPPDSQSLAVSHSRVPWRSHVDKTSRPTSSTLNWVITVWDINLKLEHVIHNFQHILVLEKNEVFERGKSWPGGKTQINLTSIVYQLIFLNSIHTVLTTGMHTQEVNCICLQEVYGFFEDSVH